VLEKVKGSQYIPVFPQGLQLQGGGTSAASSHVGALSLTPPPPR